MCGIIICNFTSVLLRPRLHEYVFIESVRFHQKPRLHEYVFTQNPVYTNTFSPKTPSTRIRFHRKRKHLFAFSPYIHRKMTENITFETVFILLYENDTKPMCRCNTIVAFSVKTYNSCRPGVQIPQNYIRMSP